jgi:hypothetical protein
LDGIVGGGIGVLFEVHVFFKYFCLYNKINTNIFYFIIHHQIRGHSRSSPIEEEELGVGLFSNEGLQHWVYGIDCFCGFIKKILYNLS